MHPVVRRVKEGIRLVLAHTSLPEYLKNRDKLAAIQRDLSALPSAPDPELLQTLSGFAQQLDDVVAGTGALQSDTIQSIHEAIRAELTLLSPTGRLET